MIDMGITFKRIILIILLSWINKVNAQYSGHILKLSEHTYTHTHHGVNIECHDTHTHIAI